MDLSIALLASAFLGTARPSIPAMRGMLNSDLSASAFQD